MGREGPQGPGACQGSTESASAHAKAEMEFRDREQVWTLFRVRARLAPGSAGAPQGQLFAALKRVKLVPEDSDWQAVRYSRCGRTDKGVSALGQVPPLHVV